MYDPKFYKVKVLQCRVFPGGFTVDHREWVKCDNPKYKFRPFYIDNLGEFKYYLHWRHYQALIATENVAFLVKPIYVVAKCPKLLPKYPVETYLSHISLPATCHIFNNYDAGDRRFSPNLAVKITWKPQRDKFELQWALDGTLELTTLTPREMYGIFRSYKIQNPKLAKVLFNCRINDKWLFKSEPKTTK